MDISTDKISDYGSGDAKAHYHSDVLAGYALGHFFSAFINDAFLGLDNKKLLS